MVRAPVEMKTLLSLIMVMALVIPAASQKTFPTMTGEMANGQELTLPRDLTRKHTIIGLAYSPKASSHLEEWLEPAYLRFVAQHGLFAGEYDADIYFIPVFVGLNKSAYEPSLKKFRKSASPEIEQHVLFSKEDMAPVKEILDLDEKDIPYFFVLDRSGRVIHRTQGAFSEDKLEAIENVLLD